RQLRQQVHVPRAALHQLDRLLGADAARRALTAALVLEELEQIQSDGLHVILVGQNDNRVRPDKAAVFLQSSEIERDVGHRRRQNAAGWTAREISLEGVTVLHAAAELVDQLAHGDAGGSQLHARILHAARYRETAEALALVTALRGRPFRALLDEVADPVHRLDVLLERRAAEQADLRDVRRTMAGQTALALDRFDHRRLFATDIGAGAAAQMQPRVRRQPCAGQLVELLLQHQAEFGVFVADVDIGVVRLDHPGGDQHALGEAVRVALEIVAILEGYRLAFV